MSALTRFLPLERRALAADALLVAVAAGAAAVSLVTMASERGPDAGWYEPVLLAVMVGVVLVCPWVAWRLHGRRTTASTVPGVVLGALVGAPVVLAATWAVAGIAAAVSWISRDAVSQGPVVLAIAGCGVVALLARLGTDAVRDLLHGRRHVPLDVSRLAATVVALGTTAVVLRWSATRPDQQPGDVLAFALVLGLMASIVVLGADVTARRAARPVSAS